MNEKGFLPFTSIGLILLILAVSTVGYYHWNAHQDKMSKIRDYGATSLSTSLGISEQELETQLKEDLHNSLWTVGENAYRYENNIVREEMIKRYIKSQFCIRYRYLYERQKKQPNGSNFYIDNLLGLDLDQGENGYPTITAHLSDNSSLSERLPDGSISVNLPINKLKASSDVRYYLLQNKMNNFSKNFDSVERRWAFAEYALAYIDVWGRKNLELSRNRTKALFNLSLASHEIEKFGSTDYISIAMDLAGIDFEENKIIKEKRNVTINPLKEKEIEEIRERINKSISKLKNSIASLKMTRRNLERVAKYEPKEWFKEKRKNLKKLRENIREPNFRKLSKNFQQICEKFEKIYKMPQNRAENAIKNLNKTLIHLEKSKKYFENALDLVKKYGKKNNLMKQLHKDLTKKGKPLGIAKQIRRGTSNPKEILSSYRERLQKIQENLEISLHISKTFPDSFIDKFRYACRNENKKLATKIVNSALSSSNMAFQSFKQEIENPLAKIQNYYSEFSNEVDRQIKKPAPNWEKSYPKYSEPGEEYYKKEKTAEKYVIRKGEGTLGGLLKVLKNAEYQLESVISLNNKFEEQKGKLKKFDTNDKLNNRLSKSPEPKILNDTSREDYYESSPPEPLYSDPGVSVYHNIEIDNIKYDRKDPVGQISDNIFSPTPIYLWFINTTLWWTSWEITIELKEPIVEEIYDYKNMAIPRPTDINLNFLNPPDFVYKPLPYKQTFEKTEFNFHLATISLRYYEVNSP